MTNITEQEFLEIFDNEDAEWDGDNALQGLNIIAKYVKDDSDVLTGATHDMIYSANVEELINSGITKEDVNKLRMLNWMVEDGEYLACFVQGYLIDITRPNKIQT